MIREHFQYRTTIATILAERREHIEAAKDAMIAARTELEAVIATDPFFGVTYEPYPAPSGSLVARRMAHAAERAGVGPMAAVAGTIAWAGVEAMAERGAEFAIVDNGGDIAVIADRPVRIGLYAGTSPLSGKLAFLLPPQEKILGICTSSATVGPSVSFGSADAVTVFARDVSLADAWATSLCNVTGTDTDHIFSDLNPDEIQGVFIVHEEQVYRWGKLPEIAAADVDLALITAGR